MFAVRIMSFRKEDRLSVYGVLRPNEGQTVSRAVVATYSLDLIALLGLVLALGGEADDEFEQSPLGLVQAFDSMKGRLQVFHQHGRIVAPRAHRSILPLLDTMTIAVHSDEREQSWHPKVALVRYEGASVEWRFWIGSRNLTGSSDLDAGLLLISSDNKFARPIPDIADLAQDLFETSKLTAPELKELRTVGWISPPGVTVRNILWRRDGQKQNFIKTPLLKNGQSACAVSPFVDRTGLTKILSAGCNTITVLTTEMAANNCLPPRGISFRVGTAPEPDAEVSVEQQIEDKKGEFAELPMGGVHAKLLAVTKGKSTALMLGSANLTERGLIGPNAEAVAILDVKNSVLTETLQQFVDSGFEFRRTIVDDQDRKREHERRKLDEQISLLLKIDLRLIYDELGLRLIIPKPFDKLARLAHFEVSPFLGSDEWVLLSSGLREALLLKGEVTVSTQTSLIAFRAACLSDPEIQRNWVLSLPVVGLNSTRRDQALLVHYIGAHRFRDWLRSLLEGVDRTMGQRWSEQTLDRGQEGNAKLSDLFTLETMLSNWARDPRAFESRVSYIMPMLQTFREAFEALPDEVQRRAALDDLNDIEPFIQAVHHAVLGIAS
jgi:HKD family nuclease